MNEARSELGARFDYLVGSTRDWTLTLRTRAAWAHEFDRTSSATALFQTLPVAPFTVFGAVPARDTALTSVGAELKLGHGVSLIGKFDGQFGGNTSVYSGTGTLRANW